MIEDRLGRPELELPKDALEQLSQLPSRDEQELILVRLYNNIDVLLTGNGITIDKTRSSFRVKTAERIQAKLKRRGSEKLILDIYGIQLILPQDQIYPSLDIIKKQYPTPDVFPLGIPSLRDYNDPTIPYNPFRQDAYKAVHKNIVFVDEPYVGIAELKVMTPEQLVVAENTRAAYDAQREAYERLINP